MGYFDANNALLRNEIAAPTGLELWPDGEGGYTLQWRRLLSPVSGYLVLRGHSPDQCSEVARLAAHMLRWPVPADGGEWLAVAAFVGQQTGPASLPVQLIANTPHEQPTESNTTEQGVCPGCHEPLRWDDGLLRCGGCGRTWLDDRRGGVLDLAALAYGACTCCRPRYALLESDGLLVCAGSGERHLLRADGVPLLVAMLPYGICTCCAPPQPLIRSDTQIVCYANPAQTYVRQGNAYVAIVAPSVVADANAIDEALRRNSALLGPNGVFVVED